METNAKVLKVRPDETFKRAAMELLVQPRRLLATDWRKLQPWSRCGYYLGVWIYIR